MMEALLLKRRGGECGVVILTDKVREPSRNYSSRRFGSVGGNSKPQSIKKLKLIVSPLSVSYRTVGL